MSYNLPIPKDEMHLCKGTCNKKTPHTRVAYLEADYWTCKICGHKEQVDAAQSSFEFSEESRALTREEIERARRNISGIVGDIQTHKWGKNLGKKDRNFLQRTVDRLIGIGRDLDS